MIVLDVIELNYDLTTGLYKYKYNFYKNIKVNWKRKLSEYSDNYLQKWVL